MYKFDPKGEAVEAAFRAIALDQLDEALADLAAPEPAGRSVVHEARRRCKKLRGLLRLVRRAFPDFAIENAALRDAAASLSHLRDAEVLRHTIADLRKWRSTPSLGRVADHLAGLPEPAGFSEKLIQFRDSLVAVRQRAERWSLTRTGAEALMPGLRTTFRDGRRQMRKAHHTGLAPAFHEWRKAVKYHGFHVDLLKRSAPDILPAELGAVDRLSALLGQHHDLAVLREALRDRRIQIDDPADAAAVEATIAERSAQIEAEAADLGRQVFAEHARALASRFTVYWNSTP